MLLCKASVLGCLGTLALGNCSASTCRLFFRRTLSQGPLVSEPHQSPLFWWKPYSSSPTCPEGFPVLPLLSQINICCHLHPQADAGHITHMTEYHPHISNSRYSSFSWLSYDYKVKTFSQFYSHISYNTKLVMPDLELKTCIVWAGHILP